MGVVAYVARIAVDVAIDDRHPIWFEDVAVETPLAAEVIVGAESRDFNVPNVQIVHRDEFDSNARPSIHRLLNGKVPEPPSTAIPQSENDPTVSRWEDELYIGSVLTSAYEFESVDAFEPVVEFETVLSRGEFEAMIRLDRRFEDLVTR